MADFTKLIADVHALSDKVDALIAKVAAVPPAPVDDQPAVDALDATVVAIAAKIV